MENIIEIKNLTKNFTNIRALDNVSLDIEEGSITGLLGPNGAGKTTLIRILTGIIAPDSGSVEIMGNIATQSTTDMIGYMPEERGLYDKMTVEDQIIYFGLLKGGNEAQMRPLMKEYLHLFGLEGQGKRKIKEFSKGNQQKIQIITTLIHDPKIVVLDEPFSGFDPINGSILRKLLHNLQNRGISIILSSHNMPAIEEMCSDIALISEGRLLVKDKIENIKEQHRDGTLLITTRTPLDTGVISASGIVRDIAPAPPANWRKGHSYRLRLAPSHSNSEILELAGMQADITQFEEVLPSLNDIFISYTLSPDAPKDKDTLTI